MSENKPKPDDLKIIVINESDFQSIASDIFTFGVLMGCFYLNYAYLGDSSIIKILIAVCFFITASVRSNSKIRMRMSRAEALEYLQRTKRDDPL